LGQRPIGAILHSSNQPGELLQWLCHDDSTINIVVVIIIIIIRMQMEQLENPQNTTITACNCGKKFKALKIKTMQRIF